MQGLIETIREGASFVVRNDAPTILKAFNDRDTHPFFQFVKYGLSGVVAVIAHMAVFYALANTSILPAMDHSLVNGETISDALRARNGVINNSIAWIFANCVAYYLNVLWVFTPGRHNRWIEFGLFSLVALVGFVGGILGGPLLIRLWGINTHLSQLLFVITSACVNFLCRKFFIFEK